MAMMSSTAILIYLRWINRQLSNNAYGRLFSSDGALKVSAPQRMKMPERHDGKRVNDRWLCDSGHLHPGRQHAVRCNQRNRKQS